MKRIKNILSFTSILLIVVMLTGCLSVDMKVKKNGSLDMTYTIDISQTQGMMPTKDIEKAIEDSVDDINDRAGKKIAKLKNVKTSKKNITASVSISDINDMDDGSFFGTVKEYRKNDVYGLDNLVNTKNKQVDEDKVSDKLHMVYFPMGGTEQYGLVEITVTVPGNIQYVTDGADIDKKSTAVFSGQNPLVVFKKGGGFPVWPLLIVVAGLVIFFMTKKKKPAAPINTTPVSAAPMQAPPQSPQNAAPQAPQAPQAQPVQPPVQSSVDAPPATESSTGPEV
ncbi:MAG: hypothetical protein ACOYIF_05490 [Acetivibrionales bacterium]|jgi:hypothetical protein